MSRDTLQPTKEETIMPATLPDDSGRAIDVYVTRMGTYPNYTYRVHSDASVQLQQDTFCKIALALKAATRIGRCYSNGAVIHIISADGDPIWSEVYRPPRALWQPIARAFLSYFQVGVFVATLIASGVYVMLYGDVYDETSARLIEQLQTPIGLIVVAISIMTSVVTTVTVRVALDHKKSWILRREVIARSVSLGCIAIFALPMVMVAVFVSNEIILTAMICLLSGLLALFVFSFVRILTSVYCYANDVREND